MYSVATDTDVTSKMILKNGQLQQRTTMIPINKISPSATTADVIRIAENLVGKENVQHALQLIEYDREVDKVMKYVFGRVFICRDINIAKQVSI